MKFWDFNSEVVIFLFLIFECKRGDQRVAQYIERCYHSETMTFGCTWLECFVSVQKEGQKSLPIQDRANVILRSGYWKQWNVLLLHASLHLCHLRCVTGNGKHIVMHTINLIRALRPDSHITTALSHWITFFRMFQSESVHFGWYTYLDGFAFYQWLPRLYPGILDSMRCIYPNLKRG